MDNGPPAEGRRSLKEAALAVPETRGRSAWKQTAARLADLPDQRYCRATLPPATGRVDVSPEQCGDS